MKTARGSAIERKNRAVLVVMINGILITKGMEIEITGYDQLHMDRKEQITVRGIVRWIDDCMLCVWNSVEGSYYIHTDGVSKIVYDFEEGE